MAQRQLFPIAFLNPSGGFRCSFISQQIETLTLMT